METFGARKWDDYMARLGVALHGSLTLELAALQPLAERERPSRYSWAPHIDKAIDIDRQLLDALNQAAESAQINLNPPLYQSFRATAERHCGYLREDNTRYEEGRRACEKHRKRNLQDWWTVRCVWDPPDS